MRDSGEGAAETGSPLLGLQRTAGNAAVSRLVESGQTAVEAGAASDRPPLKEGDGGDDVALLQRELNAARVEPQVRDFGYFMADTRQAVLQFQRGNGIEPVGRVGPKTWNALDAISADRVLDKQEYAAYKADTDAARALQVAGDYEGAATLLRALYANPKAGPQERLWVIFYLGECEHSLGNFDAATSLYQEVLALPLIDTFVRREVDQRLREARLRQGPAKSESSEVSERKLKADEERPESPDRPPLKEGDGGEDVALLQRELNAAGVDPQVLDYGYFMAETRQAVLQFQRSNGIEPVGRVGPKTWGMLDAISGDRVLDKQEYAEYKSATEQAHALQIAGDYAAAAALFQALYANPKAGPQERMWVTFYLGECEHSLANFDTATGYYQEVLALPLIDDGIRRSIGQRLREARLHQAPARDELWEVSEREAKAREERPESPDRPPLKEGDTGDDVALLQRELNAARVEPQVRGYGYFDPETTKAVLQFQRVNGIEPVGRVGPKTWGMLDAISGDRVLDKQEYAAYKADTDQGRELKVAGDYEGAKAVLEPLYANPKADPGDRLWVIFYLGECEHSLGNFDSAAGYYQEVLSLPLIDDGVRRSIDQRLREARLRQPPAKDELFEVSERKLRLRGW